MNEPEVQLHIKSEIQEVETPPNVIDHPGSKEVKEPIAYDNQNNSNLVDNTLVKTEDKPNKIQCEVCLKEFQKKIELVDHLQSRVPPANNYKCCACGKCFKDNSQLSVHGRKHTGEKPYKCKECGKCFSINGNLSKHMRTHTGERRFECATCGRKFMQYAHLEDHMKIHSGDRPYTCGQCHSAFKTKARLRKHVKSHDDTVPKRRCVRCHICNQAMQTSTQLVGHMMNHSDNALNNLVDGQIAFPCQVCEKKFKNLFLLRNHLKIHDGIRAFICPICQKTFVTASQLRRHENTHIGHRPFACNQCERSFGSHQNLKRHLLTHTGVKPYVCKMCDKGFLTLENMTRHLRTHTGEKPYSCDVCGRSFAHSTTAKEHRRLHTGDKPFGCTMCNKRFPVNKTLYRHMRASHPDYYETFKKMDQIPLIVRREIAHNFDQDTYQEAEYVDHNGTIKQEIKTEPEEIPEISPPTVKIKKKGPYVRKELPPIEIKVEELPQVNQIQSEVKLEPYDKDLDFSNMTRGIKTEIKTECFDEVNSFHNHFMYMSTNEDLDKDIKDSKLEFKDNLTPLIEMKEEIEINIHNII